MKYPDHLNDSEKSHYTYLDVFDGLPMRWIRAFISEQYNIDMHSQAFYEMNIVIKGNGMHYIESQHMPTRKGDIFIIPPNIRHGYSSEGCFDVFHILIHELFMARYAEELEAQPNFHLLFSIEPMMRADGSLNLYLDIDDDGFAKINDILTNILNWNILKDMAARVICNGYALLLIVQICELYNERHLRLAYKGKDDNDTVFMRSISYIYDHYAEKILIDDLAEISYLSRNAYINRFKKVMHMTPGDFMLNYRLKKAEEMLKQTNLSISEIAIQTGFYDISHLRKRYEKQNGRLLTDIRKNR